MKVISGKAIAISFIVFIYINSAQAQINVPKHEIGFSADYVDGFSKAADPDNKDFYSNYSIGLIYTFGKHTSLDCPIMRY